MGKYKFERWQLDGYKMPIKDFIDIHQNLPYDKIYVEEDGCLKESNIKELNKYQGRTGYFRLRKVKNYLVNLWYIVKLN